MKRAMASLALLAAACGSATSAADWAVVPDESRLSFVSVKAGVAAEVHHFPRLEGAVTADGAATVNIPLDTVETLVDIRNERMREFLFETATFPLATVTAQLDLAQFDDLAVGERETLDLRAELDLHGVTANVSPTVYVTRVADDRVHVETVDPIVVNAGRFDLMAGLAKLQELAGLPGITPDSPVTFSVMFEREG